MMRAHVMISRNAALILIFPDTESTEYMIVPYSRSMLLFA